MTVLRKVIFATGTGWLFYSLLILTAYLGIIPSSGALGRIIFWNAAWIGDLGKGVPDAYRADGTPVFFGDTEAWLGLFGFFSGFVIYPVIVLIVLLALKINPMRKTTSVQ